MALSLIGLGGCTLTSLDDLGPGATNASSTTGAGTGGASSSAAGQTTGGAGGTGGSAPLTLEYAAAIADCIYEDTPDPDACRDYYAKLWVDSAGGPSASQATHSYLRFDLDDKFDGLRIVDVRLEITVPNESGCNSGSSGRLWEVMPFIRDDLFNGLIPAVGMLGEAQGPVELGEVIAFSLPLHIVSPNGSIYLHIDPSGSDGVGYFNDMGLTPPKLIITPE